MRKKGYRGKFIVLLGGTMLLFGLFWGAAFASEEEEEEIIIVAHRAGAARGPENTLTALERAIADGAVMAEIDVQQLGDGTLIVMHDSNFARTTGIDMDVWETDYKKMQELGLEKIPTLEEMLLCAENRIFVMLELKITGHEETMTEDVVRLLQKYGMENRCIVGSANLGALERVKNIDGRIFTLFITHTLQRKQEELDFVDGYSIEGKNLTEDMTERLHGRKKDVYGWTANTTADMLHIYQCGADGIITDKVVQGKNFVLWMKLRKAIPQWQKRWYDYAERNIWRQIWTRLF